MTKECKKCGGIMNHREGNKAGKPWAGYFCEDKSCKSVEWIDLRNAPKLPPKGGQPNWNEINARKEEGMEWLNAKNNATALVSAAIQKGELNLADYLDAFKDITEQIFNFQEPRKK